MCAGSGRQSADGATNASSASYFALSRRWLRLLHTLHYRSVGSACSPRSHTNVCSRGLSGLPPCASTNYFADWLLRINANNCRPHNICSGAIHRAINCAATKTATGVEWGYNLPDQLGLAVLRWHKLFRRTSASFFALSRRWQRLLAPVTY